MPLLPSKVADTLRKLPISVIVIAAGILLFAIVGIYSHFKNSKEADARQQQEADIAHQKEALQLEKERLELEEKKQELDRKKREDDRKQRELDDVKAAQKKIDDAKNYEEQRKANVIAQQQRQEDEKKAAEENKKRIEKQEAAFKELANGNVVNHNFEKVINDVGDEGLTSDQRELMFTREGENKWFVVTGTIHDVGTWLGSKYVTLEINSGNMCDVYLRKDFDLLAYKKGGVATFVAQYTFRGTGIVTHHKVVNATEMK